MLDNFDLKVTKPGFIFEKDRVSKYKINFKSIELGSIKISVLPDSIVNKDKLITGVKLDLVSSNNKQLKHTIESTN